LGKGSLKKAIGTFVYGRQRDVLVKKTPDPFNSEAMDLGGMKR